MNRTVVIYGVNKYHAVAIEVEARIVDGRYVVSYEAYDAMRAAFPRKGIDDSIVFETIHGESLIPALLETHQSQDCIVLERMENANA